MAISNVEKAVRKVEAEALAEAEKRHADAVALSQDLMKAKAALAEVEDVPEELLSAAKAGKDVPAAALVEARSNVELAQARVNGLTARVNASNRNKPVSDASGAEMVAPLFAEQMKGVPVITAAAPLAKVIDAVKGGEGPAIILCQESATERLADGFVKVPRITGVFVRPSWAADIRLTDMAGEPSRKRGINMKVSPGSGVGDYQTFNVNVVAGAEVVPVIPKIDHGLGVNSAMQTFGRAVIDRLGGTGDHPTIRNGVYSYTAPRVKVDLAGLKVNEKVDEDGKRTTTLQFGCHMHAPDYDPAFVGSAPYMAQVGGMQPHLGRLTDIAVTDATKDPRHGTVSKTVTLAYESRLKV